MKKSIFILFFFKDKTNSVQKPDRHKTVKTGQVAKIKII